MDGKMKKIFRTGCLLAAAIGLSMALGLPVCAKNDDTVKNGIYAGEINLSGMTKEQADEAVTAYVDGLQQTEITLIAADEREVPVTAGELGISWANPELVDGQCDRTL